MPPRGDSHRTHRASATSRARSSALVRVGALSASAVSCRSTTVAVRRSTYGRGFTTEIAHCVPHAVHDHACTFGLLVIGCTPAVVSQYGHGSKSVGGSGGADRPPGASNRGRRSTGGRPGVFIGRTPGSGAAPARSRTR